MAYAWELREVGLACVALLLPGGHDRSPPLYLDAVRLRPTESLAVAVASGQGRFGVRAAAIAFCTEAPCPST